MPNFFKSQLLSFLLLLTCSCDFLSKNDALVTQKSHETWRNQHLVYTKHSRCRMECRNISEEEVTYILHRGTVNLTKSKEDDTLNGHCPSYALEGITKDGQQVRIVFGACEDVTKVITAIDLKEDYPCSCK